MLLPRGWWRRAEAARGERRLRRHLPGNGDRSTLPLLFIFQATKAPVKCVSSLTLERSPGSSSGSDQLPVPGGSRDCANCLGPNKYQGPESPGSPGFGGGPGQEKWTERGIWPQTPALGLAQLANCVGLRPCWSGARGEGTEIGHLCAFPGRSGVWARGLRVHWHCLLIHLFSEQESGLETLLLNVYPRGGTWGS